MKPFNFLFLLLIVSTAFAACGTDDDNNYNTRQFGIFRVLEDNTSIEMEGTISSNSLNDFNALEAAFPDVNQINIKNCDGSSDDDVNLQLALKVHQKGIATHLMDNCEVASGGVDFFIAGVQRSKGDNVSIGVHSWGDSDGTEAADYPVGDAVHLPYINYYVSVGFTQQQAEDFYYFTINSAPADSLHWMTAAEIDQYGLITE